MTAGTLPKDVQLSGLTDAEAKRRLEHFGPNVIPEKARKTLWQSFLKQFRSPLIYILLFALAFDSAAWILEGAKGLPLESLAIAVILLVNAFLGLRQEYRAEAALEHLKDLSAPQVWVMREGKLAQLAASQVVPGDLVRLEAGERLAADGLVVKGQGLIVDESVLTGEAAGVGKTLDDEVFAGTLITQGTAFMEVSRTGITSAKGKLAHLLSSLDTEKTPLEQRLEHFSNQIARWIIGLALILTAITLFYDGISHFASIFLFAVALAVAAIPEGLPAILTTTLALGTERMARHKAVVRRLAAVEALGSVTVIATDKTGTLTENRMQVRTLDTYNRTLALRTMVIASDADLASGVGDPVDLALLEYAKQHSNTVEKTATFEIISTKPFDSAWKYTRVSLQEGSQVTSYFKGAAEVLLSMSGLAQGEQNNWLEKLSAYGAEGYRTLGLATSRGESESKLTFLGLVLLHDPARAEVPEAIRQAQNAGIRVIMMTGDHPATALAVANTVGIDDGRVLLGSELEQLSELELSEALKECHVLARVSPEHKLKVVEALKAGGEIVAVTGDGINDAPALKRSHVGVAMGIRGSEVSKEVADLVLLDDNFSTIVKAIEEGRSIYTNIQKFIRFLFATNLAEVLLIVAGMLFAFIWGWRQADSSLVLPLTAVQILWINLLTDALPALGLALDKNLDSMTQKPRAAASPLLDRLSVWYLGFSATLLAAVAAFAYWYFATQKGNFIEARTMAFYLLIFGQLGYVFSVRQLGGKTRLNPFLLMAVALSFALQVTINYLPTLQAMLGLSRLEPTAMLILLALAALISTLSGFFSQFLKAVNR
ncbi:MAG: cation-transporting P-type ATPase [Trueperaceae bacterium]|nr:cation-transporting P-type ATPase [Trueperaceae bacterium]